MTMRMPIGRVTGGRRLNGPVALGGGAVFVLVGLVTMLGLGGRSAGPTGTAAGASAQVSDVLVPDVLIPAILDLAAGAVLVAAGILGGRPARIANLAVGAGCLATVLIGLVDVGAGRLGAYRVDTAAHLALGLLLLAVGVLGDRD